MAWWMLRQTFASSADLAVAFDRLVPSEIPEDEKASPGSLNRETVRAHAELAHPSVPTGTEREDMAAVKMRALAAAALLSLAPDKDSPRGYMIQAEAGGTSSPYGATLHFRIERIPAS